MDSARALQAVLYIDTSTSLLLGAAFRKHSMQLMPKPLEPTVQNITLTVAMVNSKPLVFSF
jgi:hypothetical protein